MSVLPDPTAAFVSLRPYWDASVQVVGAAHALDLTGDGARELLLSYRWPQLGFHVLSGLGGPAATRAVAHAASDTSGSELTAVWSGDLDGDGGQEIVAAFGPWTAFDLRVFRAGDDGRLELLARRHFGRVTGLTSLRRGDERLLVAINDEHGPDPTLFPTAPHTGEVAGVHLLRWDGAALGDAGLLPLPRNAATPVQSGGVVIAADLDGDGKDEIIAPDTLTWGYDVLSLGDGTYTDDPVAMPSGWPASDQPPAPPSAARRSCRGH